MTGQIGRSLRQAFSKLADFEPIYAFNNSGGDLSEGAVYVDVGDPASLRSALQRTAPDAVVHLAGITGALAGQNTKRLESVNVSSVATIAAAAADFGIGRVVFSSSAAVYGDAHLTPVSEVSSVNPSSPYGLAKLRAEAILRDRPVLSAPKSVSLRIFNVYGEDESDSLVSRLLRSTADHPVSLRGMDSFVRDYIHRDDVAVAILASLTSDLPVRDSIFNIGSGIAMTNRKLIETLSARKKIHYRMAEEQPSFSCADVRLARDQLGFVSTRNI